MVASELTRDRSHEQARAAGECAEWQLWLLMEGKRSVTREDYLRTVAALLRRNPDTPFADFTPSQFMEVIAAHPRGSQRKVRAHLQSFAQWGVLMGLLDRNPLERVPKIKRPQQKVVETFTDAECAALMGPPLIDGVLFTLMLECGLRKTECRNLQRKHVDLDRLQVVVLDGKGGKGRVVPFGSTSPLAAKIADLDLVERLGHDDFLWYSTNRYGRVFRKGPIGDGTFHRWYDRAIRAAGVSYVPGSIHNPHTTRHTYVTRLLVSGVPLQVVAKWAGHASVATTADIYGHLTTQDERRFLELLERI